MVQELFVCRGVFERRLRILIGNYAPDDASLALANRSVSAFLEEGISTDVSETHLCSRASSVERKPPVTVADARSSSLLFD